MFNFAHCKQLAFKGKKETRFYALSPSSFRLRLVGDV